MTGTVRHVSAWKESLIRLISKGTPITIAANQLRVGKSKIFQEFRRDPEFKKRVEEAREGILS